MFDNIFCKPENADGMTYCDLVFDDGLAIGFGFGTINATQQSVLVSVVSIPDYKFFRCDVSGYCYGRNYNTSSITDY